MDPYLEAHWGDIQTRLVTYASDELRRRLPDDLRARVEERVYVEADDRPARSIYPDVQIIERPRVERPAMSGDAGGIAVADEVATEPIVLRLPSEEKTEGFIEIREVGSGGRVITVIEFLSPPNKAPGDGKKLYLRKQQELSAAEINSVEIDLLRGGEFVLACPEGMIPTPYLRTYRICVRRASKTRSYEWYSASLREPLPTIRIPLRPTDQDARLNLQALIQKCYENGNYDDIDYHNEPRPALSDVDAPWAAALLRENGRRS
jgi:hypothetical protein